MSFRSEIFKLCKVIQKDDNTKMISDLLHNLSAIKEGEELKPNRADFKQVAQHTNKQFYGYLFTNEHVQDYKAVFPQITPLAPNEIRLLSRAHATIIALIDGCLSDFKKDYPKIYFAIEPYSKYKPINEYKETSLIKAEDYEGAITAFKSSALYQKLYTSKINVLFEELKVDDINMMFTVLEKELTNCPLDIIPESIENFMKCLYTNYKEMPDVLMAETILILGLRRSLENACSLLFTALVGEDLTVLDNDNIINIENNSSNRLYKSIELACEGIIMNVNTDTVGDIALVDCTPCADYHIHEFGYINSYTASFNQEMGHTSKITIVTIDDLLNPIFTLTNQIIQKDFPTIFKQHTPAEANPFVPNKAPQKKIPRNDKCPCGSGLKYKYCCGKAK